MAKQNDYLSGFGNEFESEAHGYQGALPVGLINPQRCKYNLFAEQLSGSAFTAPRGTNKRTWFYRLRPSVCHEPFKPMVGRDLGFTTGRVDPNQRRWSPFKLDTQNQDIDQSTSRVGNKMDFVDGLRLLAFSDESRCSDSSSIAIYVYLANENMNNKCMTNSDGDFLIVPQEGTLRVTTEFGCLIVEPNEIVIIQQGMKFTIDNNESDISRESFLLRGYVLEVRGNHFELPYLGPIGANGLANPRDFQVPRAQVDDQRVECKFAVVCKFQNELFETNQKSPYDVAAWFGNYVPYKYNLEKFVTLNSVSVDHPDPSIFTVLTCPSIGKPGTALADFVIFPPRWECAQNTFRPPYYHRNCMTEFMGLIRGQYQAKSGKFAPGGASLHQAMIPHGPDKECFEMASKQDTSVPKRVADNTMAFMFETSLSLKLTQWALNNSVDEDYHKCWQGLANINIKIREPHEKQL